MILLVFTLLSLCFVSAGGFGSSYVPKVDGIMQLGIPIGHNSSYFIYPQNSGDKILLVQIVIDEGSEVLINELEEYYEIPAQTLSDDFKIELVFGLDNNPDLIGQKFPVKYSVLTTYKDETGGAMVSFNPVEFSKKLIVIGEPEANYLPPRPSALGNIPKDVESKEELLQLLVDTNIEEQNANNPEEDEEDTGSNTLPIILGVGVLVIVGTSVIVKKYGDI